MTRHVAIFTAQAHGHVNPSLGICSELVRRGYRVSYPSIETFENRIRQTGAVTVSINVNNFAHTGRGFQFTEFPDPRFWRLYASLAMPRLLQFASGTLDQIEKYYTQNVPDLIVYDPYSLAGRILAHRLNVPAAQHWAHFAHNTSVIRENGVCGNPEPMVVFSNLMDLFMSANGILEKKSMWHIEDLYISFVARDFQFDADSFDERFCFVGPILDRPPRPPLKIHSEGKTVLLVSESTTSQTDKDFVKVCAEAFADTNYHVVFSVGTGPTRSIDPLPPNFQLNTTGAYNTDILSDTNLLICQAGMATTQEALYFGVPVLAVPMSPYHAEISHRVAELGVGLQMLEHDMTAESMREAVEQILLDKRFAENARNMQRSLQRCGGAKQAVDRIEAFMGTTSCAL